ncbi:bifunctional diguanylate cyclase/phosphodiesterase [Shewanella psychrotolerans]|uniref:bifunctional diguanylate cyclase/phosphodiesterase n=1 Tax=Shewanella psychrotolerans TaxID=2864206 RepID=UPI001C660C20|nr:diguanylate cyclase [Shewanella psychrotolerans]QYK01171.1 diguanylate cyclase [Shewanella psychrotolerans]
MFREKTDLLSPREIGRLYKRISRLKSLALKYKRSEVVQNTLFDISNLAATVEREDEFYSGIQSSLNKLLPADNFFIAILNQITGDLNIPFWVDEKDPHPSELYPLEDISSKLFSGLTGYVLKQKKTLLCDSDKFEELVSSGEIVSRGSDCHLWLGVPIYNGEQAIGVIVVQSYNKEINYGDIEVELMTFISQHISGVIERVQHRHHLEAAIKHRTKELSVAYDKLKQEVTERRRAENLQKSLFEIAELSNSNLDDNTFYAELHRVISHLLPANNCYIGLLDESNRYLQFPFYVSQLNVGAPKRRPFSDGLTEFILKQKKPLLLDNNDIKSLIASKQLYAKAPQLNYTETIYQWIGVPLFIQGIVKGALTIYSFTPSQTYQEKDLDLLTFVSQHIATAIERKLSAESLRQSYEQLEEKVTERTRALAMLNQDLEKEIAQRCKVEQQLVHDASHDTLTGLPNRARFMERLSQGIKHVRRHGLDRFAILFIDLDRFKLINDTLGHLQGDKFLIETARRLNLCIRDNDTLARIGGDEFVILLDSINDTRDAIEVTERILGELSQPYELANQSFTSGASIGISFSSRNSTDTSESILRDADAAMYQAKSNGKGCYVIYDNSISQQKSHDITLEIELREAIAKKALALQYFPVMTLDSEKVIALEPKLYWQHSQLGKIKQAQLNNIAEHCNLTKELDLYLFDQINKDYPKLATVIESHTQLHIEISSEHLKHKHAVRKLKNRIKECYFKPDNLWIFFDEKSFVQDSDSHINTFNMLSKLQLNIGLSAYGSAHSALSCLSFLPLSGLKLDPSYISHLNDPQHKKLLKAHQLAAEALDLTLYVQGVKTEMQRQQLASLGFFAGQGLALGESIKPKTLPIADDDTSLYA